MATCLTEDTLGWSERIRKPEIWTWEETVPRWMISRGQTVASSELCPYAFMHCKFAIGQDTQLPSQMESADPIATVSHPTPIPGKWLYSPFSKIRRETWPKVIDWRIAYFCHHHRLFLHRHHLLSTTVSSISISQLFQKQRRRQLKFREKDFSGDLVVKTPHFQCEAEVPLLWSGTESHMQCGAANK